MRGARGRIVWKLGIEHAGETGSWQSKSIRTTLTAWLGPDLQWYSDDAPLQKTLRTRFPTDKISPADGVPGRALLFKAAATLGGEPEWLLPDEAPLPPGAVH